jgi:hypothetical protein
MLAVFGITGELDFEDTPHGNRTNARKPLLWSCLDNVLTGNVTNRAGTSHSLGIISH